MPYFVLIGAPCVHAQMEDSVWKTVLVRFKDRVEFEIADRDMLDMVYEDFNEGLPAGWTADDQLEVIKVVKTKDAAGKQFVRYGHGDEAEE